MVNIGVDYYPEHWDESLWEKDAELMKTAGVKTVRIAEFAWCRIEPRENEFDFGWLDKAVKIFAERDIDVVLCTPTNCPPLWLYEKYPDSLQWTRDSKPIATGIRGHRCYNSPSLRRLSERVILKLAEHYKDEPAVIAWQIDNELDAVHCCCPTCTEKFRNFVMSKYGSLPEVNSAYGNVVWSGEYSSETQIIPPLGSYELAWYNPAYMLDWFRFCKESVNDFVRFQADLIRSVIPDAKITTNTWLCDKTPDFHEMFKPLNFVSYDNYPQTKLPDDPEELYSHAFHLDLMRGIKRKNFWIMEQLSGVQGCWMPMLTTPKPGMIKGYSMQAIAHGADKVIHFRWRSAAKGAEMFWHGLIDQSNKPSRRFGEFTELCAEIRRLEIPENAVVNNKVAILYSSEQESALQIQPQTNGFHYYNQLKSFHDGLTALGIGCDIISEKADFSGYRVVIAPTLFITDENVSKRLHRFTEKGGVCVITNRSGVKDDNNGCIMSPLPTVYSDMTGCKVAEFDAVGRDSVKIKMGGSDYRVSQWCDILELCGAESLAEYAERFYAGLPCVTRNSFGEGICYYAGTIGERKFYKDLMKQVLSTAGIEYVDDLPQNVEITVRETNEEKFTFIFNNNGEQIGVEYCGENFILMPFECRVLKSRKG